MKIENKVDGCVRFDELMNGEVFMYEKNICIKVDDTNPNAVDLEDGTSMRFFSDDLVRRVKATLTIE